MAMYMSLRFCLNSLYRCNLNSYISLNIHNDLYPDFCLNVKKKSVNATYLLSPSLPPPNFARTEKICTFADVELCHLSHD